MTMRKMRSIGERVLYFYVILVLVLLQHPSKGKLHDLEFVVPLTDATFEHETQASTGQTTGSWLLWFYNDKMADHEHKDILGQAPPEGTIFSEHHIVVGSVGIKKCPRTHQRFGIKPRDLPALIFIHKGKFYRHPKVSSSGNPEERFHFSWDSIINFALQMGGHPIQQPASHTQKEEGAEEEDSIIGGEEAAAAAAEDLSSATFANVKAQDIPKPTNDWDDFMVMVSIMYKEFPSTVFIMLGLVLGALIMKISKKEATRKEKKS